ncbi:NUDIX domain-containing protein [Stenotrophomonas sp. P5_B8]
MTQAYAAVRSGTQWLIARKRVTNSWWSSIATPALVVEAAALLAAALTSPARADLTAQAGTLLVDAAAAAQSAWGSTPAAATTLNAVRDASAQVATAAGADTVQALQVALPSVLTAADRASRTAGFAAATPLGTPPISVWPDAGLVGRIAAAQLALETWISQRPETLVNQAGQWALPGGRMGLGEAAEPAARREFAEETGTPLGPEFARFALVEFGPRPGRVSFVLVCFDAPLEVDAGTLATLNANLAGRPAMMGRPTATSVADWELDRLQLVEQADICNVLGVQQSVVLPQVPQAGSQSIDWYAAIARYIAGLPVP